MIPIGSLCLVIIPPHYEHDDRVAGKCCTVTGQWFAYRGQGFYPNDLWPPDIDENCLKPIAPPGDPDAGRAPERLPEVAA